VENGTYWAAARYLEAERVHPNRSNPSVVLPPPPNTTKNTATDVTTKTASKKSSKSKKRKALSSLSKCITSRNGNSQLTATPVTASKRCKKYHREDAIRYMQAIVAVRSTAATTSASLSNHTDNNTFDLVPLDRERLIQQVRFFFIFLFLFVLFLYVYDADLILPPVKFASRDHILFNIKYRSKHFLIYRECPSRTFVQLH
jgi:hypothetical protein